jgi:uncharacterized protein YcbX
MSARLAALACYPVKSCAGLALDAAAVGARGLAGDRAWMLVDAEGRFVTGRQEGRLVKVCARPGPDGLELAAPGMPSLRIGIPDGHTRSKVTVWRDTVDAADAGDAAAEWFSRFLGRRVRLVHADAAMQRPVDPEYARAGDEVGFADGYPVLLLSRAAVDELSARVGRAMDWRRFRPNLLIEGVPAHAEDGWRRVRIGALEFEVVKACVRCVFTTVDPDSGERDVAGEPLKTLASYRRGPRGVTFGQNLIARGSGTIAVGDAAMVLD